MSDPGDYYFREPHRRLAWNVLEVIVRQHGRHWQFSYGYGFALTGHGSPFTGRLPSRDAAGRNGLCHLRQQLLRFAGDPGLDDERSGDQRDARKAAERIWTFLYPTRPDPSAPRNPQLEFSFA